MMIMIFDAGCGLCLQVAEEHREFSMGMTSVADSAGISIAGAISIPVHDYICTLYR